MALIGELMGSEQGREPVALFKRVKAWLVLGCSSSSALAVAACGEGSVSPSSTKLVVSLFRLPGGGGGDTYGTGQTADDLLGALLRLDVDGEEPYQSPPDNPNVDGGRASEVWEIGLRNPWRFSFDQNLLCIGDVGQGNFEEINVADAARPALTTAGRLPRVCIASPRPRVVTRAGSPFPWWRSPMPTPEPARSPVGWCIAALPSPTRRSLPLLRLLRGMAAQLPLR